MRIPDIVASQEMLLPNRTCQEGDFARRMRTCQLWQQREGVDAPLLSGAGTRAEAAPVLCRMRPHQELILGEAASNRVLRQHHHIFEGRFQDGPSSDPAHGS